MHVAVADLKTGWETNRRTLPAATQRALDSVKLDVVDCCETAENVHRILIHIISLKGSHQFVCPVLLVEQWSGNFTSGLFTTSSRTCSILNQIYYIRPPGFAIPLVSLHMRCLSLPVAAASSLINNPELISWRKRCRVIGFAANIIWDHQTPSSCLYICSSRGSVPFWWLTNRRLFNVDASVQLMGCPTQLRFPRDLGSQQCCLIATKKSFICNFH